MAEKKRAHQSKPTKLPNTGTGRKTRPEQYQEFLKHYAETGILQMSAHLADVSVENIRVRRINNEEFAQKCEEAMQTFRDSIEAEVYRRAVKGVSEPVYQGGECVGSIVRYSDRMLEMLTKRHIVEYRDKYSVDHNVSGGVMIAPPASMTAEQWEEQHSQAARANSPA